MSEETPIIREMHTSCNDCLFAIKDKQTQVGCEFNRLEAYRDAGVEVIKVYDEHNNEFDVINMRICMHKRTKAWGEQVPKSERKETVKKELRVRYHAMVHFNEDDDIEGLDSTLQSLENQYNPPRVVTILNRKHSVSQKDMVEHLSSSGYEKIEWRLQTFINPDLANRECVDIVIDGTKNHYPIVFYIRFNSGFEVPANLSEEMQKYFIEDMKRAAYAYPNSEGQGELVNSVMHQKHAGNSFNIPIVEKLKEFEEGVDEYIIDIGDICPSLKT